MKRQAKEMQKKAKKMEIRELGGGLFEVDSTSGKTYLVRAEICTCDWAKYHPDKICSHRMAVLNHIEEQAAGRRLSWWQEEEDAQRQHRPHLPVADVWATSRAAA